MLAFVLATSVTAQAQQMIARDCDEPTVVSGNVIEEGEFYGIMVYNGPGVIVEDNVVRSFHGESRSGGGGIVILNSDGAVVRNNRVFSRNATRNGVGIRVQKSADVRVENNFVDMRGELNEFDGECIATSGKRVIVRNNIVRGCPGSAF